MIQVEIKYTRGDAWQTIAVKADELDRFRKLMKQLGAKVR